ncbi:hypothetical protein [Streptomyces sp. rh34]|uniref:hypothetical protein n=1 Tax=Streptomyces sp. rh34 TaxID=2034272 RepID=UPI0011814BD2|nr:hypothetical protein [Streptomyces sp. rh34]
MTDRRPLGTGPTRADDTTGTGSQPARAGLAAERLPTISAAAAGAPAVRPQRRVLGAGVTRPRPPAEAGR